jgi:hypothetical protein
MKILIDVWKFAFYLVIFHRHSVMDATCYFAFKLWFWNRGIDFQFYLPDDERGLHQWKPRLRLELELEPVMTVHGWPLFSKKLNHNRYLSVTHWSGSILGRPFMSKV